MADPSPCEDHMVIDAADPHAATVGELQRSFADREATSVAVTRAALDRIAAMDRAGPELAAMIEINPQALDIAEKLDAERTESGPRGPLHGVPIVLKDNIDTHDEMTTTAGSLALEGSIPPRDSFVAARLRASGAVLLGKANMSEWANYRGKPSVSGWSARGGQCRNPHDPQHSPCGSSSGSAVAVAAGYVPVAIGTETNGSIVCPASSCGVAGLKPTVGLWSRSGIIPISHSQDTAGPMARSVADLAIVAQAVCGRDDRDPATAAVPIEMDLTSGLGGEGLVGARIAATRSVGTFDDGVVACFDEALAALRDAGAHVQDEIEVAGPLPTESAHVVMQYELKAGLNAYLAALGPDAPVRSLTDVIAFNESNADLEMPLFGQELLLAAQERGPLTDSTYLEALERIQRHHRDDLDQVLAGGPFDAIVVPTRDPAWPIDPTGDPKGQGSSSSPAAISGYPSVTVPMGFVDGLPVGLSFIGRPWSEPLLLRLADAFERHTRHLRPPAI